MGKVLIIRGTCKSKEVATDDDHRALVGPRAVVFWEERGRHLVEKPASEDASGSYRVCSEFVLVRVFLELRRGTLGRKLGKSTKLKLRSGSDW